MPRFKYVGPFDEVDVAGQSVARGVVAEFAADVAAGLEGQESWEPIPDEQPEKTTKKAAPKRADDSQEG